MGFSEPVSAALYNYLFFEFNEEDESFIVLSCHVLPARLTEQFDSDVLESRMSCYSSQWFHVVFISDSIYMVCHPDYLLLPGSKKRGSGCLLFGFELKTIQRWLASLDRLICL
ncbi:hypothetical protein DSUL_150044 [Desulfovibrionales bacterium]